MKVRFSITIMAVINYFLSLICRQPQLINSRHTTYQIKINIKTCLFSKSWMIRLSINQVFWIAMKIADITLRKTLQWCQTKIFFICRLTLNSQSKTGLRINFNILLSLIITRINIKWILNLTWLLCKICLRMTQVWYHLTLMKEINLKLINNHLRCLINICQSHNDLQTFKPIIIHTQLTP